MHAEGIQIPGLVVGGVKYPKKQRQSYSKSGAEEAREHADQRPRDSVSTVGWAVQPREHAEEVQEPGLIVVDTKHPKKQRHSYSKGEAAEAKEHVNWRQNAVQPREHAEEVQVPGLVVVGRKNLSSTAQPTSVLN